MNETNETKSTTRKKTQKKYSKDEVLALLQSIIDDYETGDDRVKAADYLRAIDQINKMQGHYNVEKKQPINQEFTFRFD